MQITLLMTVVAIHGWGQTVSMVLGMMPDVRLCGVKFVHSADAPNDNHLAQWSKESPQGFP